MIMGYLGADVTRSIDLNYISHPDADDNSML
jgi:hypothetical protein